MKQCFDVPLEMREEVKQFAYLMEALLKRNDGKGGWAECHPLWLLSKLSEEMGELGKLLLEIYHPTGQRRLFPSNGNQDEFILAAILEAADVANVAMMLADCLSEMVKNAD